MPATYLIKHTSSYLFRLRVPSDLQPSFGRTELRYSLQTGRLGEAKPKARLLAGLMQCLFHDIRLNGPSAADRGFIEKSIEDYIDTVRCNTTPFLQISGTPTSDDARPNANVAASDLKQIISDVLHAELEQMRIVSPDSLTDHDQTQGMAGGQRKEPDASTATISQVAEAFVKIKTAGDKWASTTHKNSRIKIQLLLEFFGDVPISTLTRRMMSQYLNMLMKLPTRRNQDPRLKGKPLEKIIEMKDVKTISPRTAAFYFETAKELLRFAHIHGHVTSNPTEGMKFPTPKNMVPDEAREAFTAEDLTKIFSHPDLLGTGDSRYTREYKFWGPILGLFTGARRNEIAQLYLADFLQVDGVWCISINDESDDKRTKTTSSKRLVPLHPFLIKELNIIGRVEKLQAQGDSRFFPELKFHEVSGYGRQISTWFNRFLRSKCQISSEKKSFHSFRHTFITSLAHNEVNDDLLIALAGHAKQGITKQTYVKKFKAQQMYDGLVKHLNFAVNLSHLTKSRFVEAGVMPEGGFSNHPKSQTI